MGDSREAFVPVEGGRLFYRLYPGAAAHANVLVLHGGPGGSLDYLTPMADLGKWGFSVVLFDNLGCGRSDVPKDTSLFSLDHHVMEVEGVRSALELGPVHLVGSSYGGLLALA